MPTDAEKLAALRALDFIEVLELVKVSWQDPDGDVYYVSTLDEYLLRDIPISGADLDIRLPGRTFQEILNDTTIADDRVTLKLWDADGAVSDLANTHGSGQRVEIFYWFPQVALLLSQWFGHLQPATEAGVDWYQCDAAVGFLSSMLPLPKRAFYTGCQALFGGLLKTQAEIDEGGCPYNRHLGAAGATHDFNPTNNANGTGGSGGAYSKTSGGAAWNCGASHSVEVIDGDALIEVTVSAGFTTVGFTITASPISGNTDFLFGLQFNPAGDVTLRGVDSGHSWAKAASWQAGDSFRIEVRAGRFRAYKGSSEISPSGYSAPSPAYPFWIGIAIYTPGAGVSAAHVAIGDIGGAPGFGNLNPATGLPFTECPRNRAACIARLGDDLSYLGFDTVIQSYTVGETKGPNITVTTRGNESNLKRPLRVVFGQRHVADLDLMAYTVEPDTKHPEGGAVSVLFAECEGPIQAQANQMVNGVAIGAMHLNARNGEARQGRTGFSVNVSNYSRTALFFGRAQGDFTKTSADQLRGESDLQGLKDVRRYTDQNTFVEEYSTVRAWCLMRCLRSKIWGYGLDVARFVIDDWIKLALSDQEMVTFTDVDGTAYNSQRTQFHAELIDRSVQQQVNDICLAGRYTLPYPDRGKLRIRPLGRAAELFSQRAIIEPAFKGVLAREPTGGEYTSWETALNTAHDISNDALVTEAGSLVAGLFGSAEYAARGRTDAEFVSDCYLAYLNRAPDTEGYANWLIDVAANGRAHVMAGFAGSDEFRARIVGSEIPRFSDRGDERNICVDEGTQKTTLVRQIVSDDQVPNRIIVNFDDSQHNNAQRPLTFEDIGQQLRAGYAFGDTSRRAVEKTYTALGVTDAGEAIRLGNLLLHLGEFDEGGTVNNLRVQFTAWFSECLTLRKYDLIEVDSAQLKRYKQPIATTNETVAGTRPFKYFRIRSMRRMANLKVQISAQAYNDEYYDSIESVITPPPIIGTPGLINPGGSIHLPPAPVLIDGGGTFHESDRILVKLMEVS